MAAELRNREHPKKASPYSNNGRIVCTRLHFIAHGCIDRRSLAHRHSIQFSITLLGEKLGIPGVVGGTLGSIAGASPIGTT